MECPHAIVSLPPVDAFDDGIARGLRNHRSGRRLADEFDGVPS